MASLARIALACCLVLLCTGGSHAYPKELIGTWMGSCQSVASANMTGMNTICTGSPKMLAVAPYMITYTAMKSKTVKGGMDLMYMWSQDATVVEYMMGNMTMSLYSLAAAMNMTYALAHGSQCGPEMYCITSKPPGVGPVAFLTSVTPVGSQMMYMEQGILKTSNSMPTKNCPLYDNLPLYCDDETFNYVCTAFKIPMHSR